MNTTDTNDDILGFLDVDGPDDHGTHIFDGRSSDSDNSLRFERVARLITRSSVERIAEKRVVLFGVGGVGSFVAEALARSGVGSIRMVDFDRVSESNINRQLPATTETIGRFKVDCLVDHFAKLNPRGYFEGRRALYHAATSDALLADADIVVDAIDNMTAKAHLLATCYERKIPLVSSMGAGGRLDPTRVQVADLCKTHGDALARTLRRILRQQYSIDTTRSTGITAIFSDEPRHGPFPQPGDDDQPSPQGTLCSVTGTFGLVAASVVLQYFLQ